jgi:glutamine synthetase
MAGGKSNAGPFVTIHIANAMQLLTEYVQKGDITIYQAIGMTKDVLFNNANTLYDLRYQATFNEIPMESPKQLTFNTKSASGNPSARSSAHPSPRSTPIPPAGSTMHPTTSGPIDPRSGSPYGPPSVPPSFPPPPKVPQVYDNQAFDDFMQRNSEVRYVYVQWLDYMAVVQSRIVPIKEFTRMIREGDRIRVSRESSKTSQERDAPTMAAGTKPEIYIEPDLRSLRRTHSRDSLHAATVFSYWRSESGAPLPSCPRTSLETLINTLQYSQATTLLIGFEVQVTILARNLDPKTMGRPSQIFFPVTKAHARGSLTLPFVSDILLALDQGGIDVQQFHAARSGQGQYILTLPPQPPLLAIDTVIQARQTITQIAALNDLHATFHPHPFPTTTYDADVYGDSKQTTSLQARISLHPPTLGAKFFVGGVSSHLAAISAFSMPGTSRPDFRVSEQKNDDSTNLPKKTGFTPPSQPLRHLSNGAWEFDWMDGTANMYLAIAAIIGAGLLGMQSVGAEEGNDVIREVVQPRDWEDMARALETGELKEALGQEVVSGYIREKDEEWTTLEKMREGERWEWGVERY